MSGPDPERSSLLPPDGGNAKGVSSDEEDENSESAPLLTSSSATPQYDGEQDDPTRDAGSVAPDEEDALATNKQKNGKRGIRWPSVIAGLVLAIIAICIMLLAFFLPAAVEEYAKEAAVLEPTNLSLESITTNGVQARIQASFRLDGTRVNDVNSRRLGRLATWVVRKLGTDETEVNVYLPEHDGTLLGSAILPPIILDVVDGHNTVIDFVADLSPGDAEAYRTIANTWLEGKLDRLRVLGKADLHLRSGIIPLGTHAVSETLILEAKKIPSIPEYNITSLSFRDVPTPDGEDGAVGADISVTTYNDFPVSLDVPELGFEILVPNCDPSEDRIAVADAITGHLTVRPHSDVVVDAQGLVTGLPESLTRSCPHTKSSPLDNFLQLYLHGDSPTVYVRGRKLPESKTPGWISDILSSVTVPVTFPSQGLGNFIREFSVEDVNFKLPGPFTNPNDPDDEGNPTISGTIQVLAALPDGVNFDINVTDLRSTSDVLYKKRKMGELKLKKWNPANSTRVEDEETGDPLVKIQSRVEDVPLNITDGDVFSEVMREMFFGSEKVMLDVDAKVDTRAETALGQLVFKDIPAQGSVPVKQLPSGDIFDSFHPQVGDLKITGTARDSVDMEATVNFTNPTPYTARIPYINVNIAKNGSVIGSATAENLEVKQGNNTDVLVRATWDPSGSDEGRETGKELLSQYLSGYNVTLDVKTHRASVPAAPIIGEALSKLNVSVPAPRLDLPGDDGDGDGNGGEDGDEQQRGHFIRDAVFHIFSSTATFILVSPLKYNTIFLDRIQATAYYNHTEPVGRIDYDLPFAAYPGATKTPKLPVHWSVGSVGYDAVKEALGGQLQLDARANVSVRIGNWRQDVWYNGRGIGAHVRL